MVSSTMLMASTLSNPRKKKNATVRNLTLKLSTGVCKRRLKSRKRWNWLQQRRKKDSPLCCQIKSRMLATRSGICSSDTRESKRSKLNLLRACQENSKTNLNRICKLDTLRSAKRKEKRTAAMRSNTTMTMTTNTH